MTESKNIIVSWEDIKEIEIRFIDKKKVILESDNAKGKITQKQTFKDVDADFMPLRARMIKELPMKFNLSGTVKSFIIPSTFREELIYMVYKLKRFFNKLRFWRKCRVYMEEE